VVINPPGYPAGDAGTDVVLVNYGATSGMIGKGVLVTNQNGATTQTGGDVPDFVVNTSRGSRAGFMNGDLILAVPPPSGGNACTIAEITGLPDGGGPGCTGDFNPTSPFVNHNDVAYPSYYTGCNPTNATWNKGGVDLGYPVGSQLYNLGPVGAFVSRVYAVRNGNLTMCDLTIKDCTAAVADPPDPGVWAPVANGVVGLKAQYGMDTNSDGAIDVWQPSPQPTGAARAQVAAVRLAVVVRSGQYEKEDATAAAPVWHQDATSTSDVSFDLTGSGSDWQHFRYKQAQSIVPVRNLIWGQQN
jgi:type IV pilus assembly protein PilW